MSIFWLKSQRVRYCYIIETLISEYDYVIDDYKTRLNEANTKEDQLTQQFEETLQLRALEFVEYAERIETLESQLVKKEKNYKDLLAEWKRLAKKARSDASEYYTLLQTKEDQFETTETELLYRILELEEKISRMSERLIEYGEPTEEEMEQRRRMQQAVFATDAPAPPAPPPVVVQKQAPETLGKAIGKVSLRKTEPSTQKTQTGGGYDKLMQQLMGVIKGNAPAGYYDKGASGKLFQPIMETFKDQRDLQASIITKLFKANDLLDEIRRMQSSSAREIQEKQEKIEELEASMLDIMSEKDDLSKQLDSVKEKERKTVKPTTTPTKSSLGGKEEVKKPSFVKEKERKTVEPTTTPTKSSLGGKEEPDLYEKYSDDDYKSVIPHWDTLSTYSEKVEWARMLGIID